jgi:hypothetical protein
LARFILVWAVFSAFVAVPIIAAAFSPQIEWRHPIYIAAGFAGIAALALLFAQPLLIGGYLPGLSALGRRHAHRWVGGILIASIVAHVGGLWITSAPDVIDALLFASPTPFSAWGVIAMWATFATGLLAALRRRSNLRPRTWRACHLILAVAAVGCTIVHVMLIEGTMETLSKVALCAVALAATFKVIADYRILSRSKSSG